jgi:hypothetical protein
VYVILSEAKDLREAMSLFPGEGQAENRSA